MPLIFFATAKYCTIPCSAKGCGVVKACYISHNTSIKFSSDSFNLSTSSDRGINLWIPFGQAKNSGVSLANNILSKPRLIMHDSIYRKITN